MRGKKKQGIKSWVLYKVRILLDSLEFAYSIHLNSLNVFLEFFANFLTFLGNSMDAFTGFNIVFITPLFDFSMSFMTLKVKKYVPPTTPIINGKITSADKQAISMIDHMNMISRRASSEHLHLLVVKYLTYIIVYTKNTIVAMQKSTITNR